MFRMNVYFSGMTQFCPSFVQETAQFCSVFVKPLNSPLYYFAPNVDLHLYKIPSKTNEVTFIIPLTVKYNTTVKYAICSKLIKTKIFKKEKL